MPEHHKGPPHTDLGAGAGCSPSLPARRTRAQRGDNNRARVSLRFVSVFLPGF